MNALTLDFIRRWKWLLAGQFLIVAGAWTQHAAVPQSRAHLEVFLAIAMSWDLMRGLVRGQLGLPQSRASVASGLWWSVVGVGAGVQIAAMLFGGVLLAPVFGKVVDFAAMGLHAVLSVLMIGTSQFLLTGLPSVPPRNLKEHLKGGLFGLMWGLSMWGFFALTFVAPQQWLDVKGIHALVMILLAGGALASWFTTRQMVMNRAVPLQQETSVRVARPQAMTPGRKGWRVWLGQEGLFVMPVVFMVLLTSVFMISIQQPMGGPLDIQSDPHLYRSMGMLCAMTLFPMLAVSVGTLRASRALPVARSGWAVVMTLRPFLGGVMVFVLFSLTAWAAGRASGMGGRAFLVFLPWCSALSLVQAVMLRHPRVVVVFGMLMVMSVLGALYSDVLHGLPAAGTVFMVGLAAGMLVLAAWLHWRELARGHGLYRVHDGFLRMMAGARR